MKNTTYIASSLLGASPSPLCSRAWAFLLTAAAILPLLLSAASSSFAGNATWLTSPATGDWNTATNWTAGGPPNGPSDMAFFATSNTTAVSLSANTEVNVIVFNAGGSAFTITASPTFTLTISGTGITNNSGIAQNFVTAVDGSGNSGTILFSNSATAGSMTVFTNNGATVSGGNGGLTEFFDTSTAGNGTFTNNGATANVGNGGGMFFAFSSTAGSATITNNAATVNVGLFGLQGVAFFANTATAGSATINNNGATFIGGTASGATEFINTATAGSATINNNGGTASGAYGGQTFFEAGGSTAGSATINNNGATVSGAFGGSASFNTAFAGNATLIANGGVNGGGGGGIDFIGDSIGGTARVEVFGDGNLDISEHFTPGVTTGSIEGSGAVFLGATELTVGSNNLTTTFSGVIQDGGMGGGTSGSLTKMGNGKLTLSNASTYTGGTTITKGTLLVTNTTGSGTGTGTVQVNKGTLGGTGKITGVVTVGTGTSSGAILLPGKSATAPGILTINSALTFNSLSTYKCVLKRSTVKASKATALGVTINSGATFTFVDTGTGTLTVGTVFTVINNTSANPIFGTFSNLANGSVFTSNGNNFQASYTGGNGNDLTLTVVP